MLKISPAETVNEIVALKLEGRVAGPWVAEMRKACERILSERRALRLDLAEVSFADEDGIAAISALKACGVTLENCSPFVAEQLKNS